MIQKSKFFIIIALLILNVILGWNLYDEYKKNEQYERDMLTNYFEYQRMIYGSLEGKLKNTESSKELAKNLKDAYAYARSSVFAIGNATPIGQHLYLPNSTSLLYLSSDGAKIIGDAMERAIDGNLSNDDIENLKKYNTWLEKFNQEVGFNYENYQSNDMKLIRENLQRFGEQYNKERMIISK